MMTVMLRVALIFVSVFTMTFMMRKIRQAKMEIEAALFWVIMALMLVVFAVFPLWQISAPDFGNLCHNEFSVSVYDLSADRKAFQYDYPYFPAGKPPEGADTEDGS